MKESTFSLVLLKKFILLLFLPSLFGVGLGLRSYAQQLQPTNTQALFKVSVIDEKKVPQIGDQVIFESAKTKKIYKGVTKDSGGFDILVPTGDKYVVKYKNFTEDADYTEIEVPVSKDEKLIFNVIIQFEMASNYTLENVHFNTGQSSLRQESADELNKLVEFVTDKKKIIIEIGGHTDNVGNPDANMKLSQDRANAVREYLISKGVEAGRVKAKGYGDKQPRAPNDSDLNRQQNRRTEVKVVK